LSRPMIPMPVEVLGCAPMRRLCTTLTDWSVRRRPDKWQYRKTSHGSVPEPYLSRPETVAENRDSVPESRQSSKRVAVPAAGICAAVRGEPGGELRGLDDEGVGEPPCRLTHGYLRRVVAGAA
jgi:hypothetical protein